MKTENSYESPQDCPTPEELNAVAQKINEISLTVDRIEAQTGDGVIPEPLQDAIKLLKQSKLDLQEWLKTLKSKNA